MAAGPAFYSLENEACLSRPCRPVPAAGPRPRVTREAAPLVSAGSAADLCKMAMIHVFAAVAASPTLTARSVSERPAGLGPTRCADLPFSGLGGRGAARGFCESTPRPARVHAPLRSRARPSASRMWGSILTSSEPRQRAPRPPGPELLSALPGGPSPEGWLTAAAVTAAHLPWGARRPPEAYPGQ